MIQFESKLMRQLELEKVISNIARKFVRVENIDDAINQALKSIGEFSGACRAYIFEFDFETNTMDNTYEWCKEGVVAEIEHLKDLPINLFPWWISKIKDGSILNIHDVSKLGEYAKAEKDILEMQGIKSVLVLPLVYRSKLRGFVGFDNVETLSTWSQEDETILGIAAEFFSNVFERILSEKELYDSNKELERVVASLQSAQSQLYQQEKMVAIGQLAAGVAHEINNPLGFMLSNNTTLKDYVELMVKIIESADKDQLEFFNDDEYNYMKEDIGILMEDLNIGLSRIEKIVRGMSYFSKVENTNECGMHDLEKIIKNTLVVLSHRLGDKIEVKLDFETGFPLIMSNETQLNHVILNLIGNAIEAIKEVEHLRPGSLQIEIHKKNDSVIMKITDNGIGMTEEVQKQMFYPFFTTKSIGKGTGLGLHLVYDIITNQHGGKIEVESKLGTGTAVIVEFPIGSMNH